MQSDKRASEELQQPAAAHTHPLTICQAILGASPVNRVISRHHYLAGADQYSLCLHWTGSTLLSSRSWGLDLGLGSRAWVLVSWVFDGYDHSAIFLCLAEAVLHLASRNSQRDTSDCGFVMTALPVHLAPIGAPPIALHYFHLMTPTPHRLSGDEYIRLTHRIAPKALLAIPTQEFEDTPTTGALQARFLSRRLSGSLASILPP
jgi:hypothetical protein